MRFIPFILNFDFQRCNFVSGSRGKRGATLLEAVGVRKRNLCDLGPQEELPEARKIRELRSSVKVKKRDDVSFQLPTKLLALRDIFVGIQTVYRMMKHRNKKTTYEELRQGVEEICKKRFEVRSYGFSWILDEKK